MTRFIGKCPYCDYEFEYQREHLLYFANTCVPKGVECPMCGKLVQHNSDTPRTRINNNITTMQAKDEG